jgi:Uroporphyrinogen decarboxylase (URO-D)
MTAKERMRLAMGAGVPDRVPAMCQLSIGHLLLQTGLSAVSFWNSAEVFARGLLAIRKSYRFDGILVSLHGHRPGWEKDVVRMEKASASEVVHWKNGDTTVFPPDDLPRHLPAQERAFPQLSGFNPESIPEEVDFIPVSQGLDFPVDPDHLYDSIDSIVSAAGAEFSVHGEVTSPFDYYLRLFGHTQALIGLVEEPDRAKGVLERYADGIVRLACGLVSHGVDAVKVSSPFAGSGFISPRFYREFVAPYEGRIAGAVRALGVPAYVHTCGAVDDRLEMMAEAGFSGIECLDPPPLGNVELAEAKRRVGGRVFIKGNIDPVHVLLGGTIEKVRGDARQRLKVGMPGGRYILSTACSVAPHTSRENVQALAEVAEEFGAYYQE